MNNRELLEKYLNKVGKLNYLVTVLRWDMDTTAPPKSYDYLIDVRTKYEMEAYDLTTSEEYINLINNLVNSNEFNELSCEEQVYINKSI